MASTNAISNATTAATALSNLVLVAPSNQGGYQPQNPYNPDGSPSTAPTPPTLVFNYEGEQTLTLESDITDHYSEDNTPINDQISLKPEQITVHGFISELNDITPAILQPLKTIANKLTTIGAYTPALSATAIAAYNEAFFLYQTAQNAANSAVSAWSSINSNANTQNQTQQQILFAQWYGYWKSNQRTLFTVTVPWGIFTDMAVKTLRVIQDAETRMISEFEITFKKFNFVSDSLIGETVTGVNAQGQLSAQSASLTDLGTANSLPASQSLGEAITGGA